MAPRPGGKKGVSVGGGGNLTVSSPVWSLLLRLAGYVRPHFWLFLFTVVAAGLAAAFELLPPFVIRAAVDRTIVGGDGGSAWIWAALLLGLSILQGGIDFFRLYLTAVVGQKIVFRIRNDLFTHLNRLSPNLSDLRGSA